MALATLLLATGCGRAPAPAEPVRAVRTVVVGTAEATGRTEYAAEIRARTESRLAFQVAGKVVARPVQLGDRVRKGQVLARLDPEDLRLVEQSANAAVQAAQANAAQAQADVKRFRGLFEQGFISAAELERRTTAATTALAQLAQARAQAEAQGRQTTHGTLTADASGVITAVEVEPGAVVAAGSPVLRLAWDGPRDVAFAVPEDRVAAMRALLGSRGALAVSLWGQPAATLRATVREISAAADPVTRTFAVKADLLPQASSPPVRLGQTAVVAVELPPAKGVIKLPLAALLQHQGRTSVWLLEGSTMSVMVQPVTLGGTEGNEALVIEGLLPGQEVVTAGVHVLTPGQRVRRFGAADPAASAAGSRTGATAASGATASTR